MIKKLILLILIIFTFCFAGCNTEDSNSDEEMLKNLSEISEEKYISSIDETFVEEDLTTENSSEILEKIETKLQDSSNTSTTIESHQEFLSYESHEESSLNLSEVEEDELSGDDYGANYTYTGEELDLLARLIYAEAGSYWLSDEHQLLTGCVVVNRVNSPYFPNSIYDVIYQAGQYPPAYNGGLNNTPDERTYENARKVLTGEYTCPSNVVWQAGFIQGDGIYASVYDEAYGTTYFCYSNY